MKEHEFDFNTEFANDLEVDEALNDIIRAIKDNSTSVVNRTTIANPSRVQQVIYTYKMLKYLTKDTNSKVSYELYKPFNSMGSVSIVGRNLNFKNTKWFIKAVEFASNFEVYPKTDGTVQMNFTFHGLTKTID